ncbi:MAG: acyl-CoA dehydrogenase [Magnetococcales bacterium]|nr:acyl-CoA dehydrogenase [Magnetococcales bacterium]
MNTYYWLVPGLLALFWMLAFYGASRGAWSGWVGLVVLAAGWPWTPLTGFHWLGAGSFLALAAVVNISSLRLKLLTSPLMGLFRKALPPLSRTEKEALEAGTVWWDREIFSGDPNWEKLLNEPPSVLSREEQAFLDGPVAELCRMIDDWQITATTQDLTPQVWRFMKEKRFFGLVIPKEYGGLGFSPSGHSAVVTKVASRSITAAVTVMVPNSLGPAELLRHYGTEAQKDHYLPRLADGREIPCFALTSPEAGSDAGSMPDTGVVCRGDWQGRKNVLGIRVNWDKRYITLAPVATVLGLAFRLHDPDGLLGMEKNVGITLALIPVPLPGMEIGSRHNPLDIPFQNGPTRGRDVFIPMEMVIGGAPRAGQGWRMLMDCLAEGRSISLPALSVGAGKTACRVVGDYARVRRQFKLPIGRFEGVQEAMGRMAGETWLMEAARRFTVSAVDQGHKPSVISALTKYQLTERMRRVVNDAMDVVGGAGICVGPRNLIAGMYRAIPVGITVEGANILTRTLIVFGQGAIRAHPHILHELQALEEPDPAKSARAFDQAFFNHVSFTLQNGARAVWYGLSGARTVKTPVHGAEKRYYQQLTRLAAVFALVTDVALLTLGGSLKRRESLSGRMADMLSHLYLGAAALKQFHERGRPESDLPLLQWAMHHNLHGAEQSLAGFLENFPFRPLAWLLSLVAAPLGRSHTPPSDRLTHQCAALLQEPAPVRDRLTAGIFIPAGDREPFARLEAAFTSTIAAEPVERKLKVFGKLHIGSNDTLLEAAVGQGVINSLEAQTLRNADRLRREVIQVDEFPAPSKQWENAA